MYMFVKNTLERNRLKIKQEKVIHLNSFPYIESFLKETMLLLSMPKNLYMSFVALVYIAKGIHIYFSALLTLKVENSLVCLVDTRIPTVYLETIPGQHSIDSLQKTAILGTSHIIRKVLQAET
jgi:hypothetical protein